MRHWSVLIVLLLFSVLFHHCSPDVVGLLRMNVEAPEFHPTLTAPMDTASVSSLIMWMSRATERTRNAALLNLDEQWKLDSVQLSDGSWIQDVDVERTYGAPPQLDYSNFTLHLPDIQFGLYGEYQFYERTSLGAGVQFSSYPGKMYFSGEARLATDYPPQRPVARTSMGVFVTQQKTNAVYFRKRNGVPAEFYATPVFRNGSGYFVEIVLSPSDPRRNVAPILAVGFTRQNLYSYGVPGFDVRSVPSAVDELLNLWSATAGFRVRIGDRQHVTAAVRIRWEPTLDQIMPGSYFQPTLQWEVRY